MRENMPNTTSGDLAATIGQTLPYLRRYARALTGSQDTGDRYAAANSFILKAELGKGSAEHGH